MHLLPLTKDSIYDAMFYDYCGSFVYNVDNLIYSDFKETGAAALQYFPLVHKGTKRHNTGRSRNNVLTRYGPIGSGKLKTCSDTVRLPSPFKKYYTMQWVSKKVRSGFSVSYRKAQRNFLGQSIIPLKGMIINIKLCFMKTTL